MKTVLTLSTKKQRQTDVAPQILVFCNNELVDEVVIEDSNSFKLEHDFAFTEGWNELSYIVNDMSWSEEDGSSWSIGIENLEVDGTNKFPVNRGDGLVPFTFEFNPADVVLEIENYDEETLDNIHYQQSLNGKVEVDCGFGFSFKVEDGKVVDHFHTGMENVTASPSLNIATGTFLKILRMCVKKSGGSNSLDDYLKLDNGSTASKYWSLPIVLQPIKSLDLMLSMCLSSPWEHTRIFRQHSDKKIPSELLLKVLTPPSAD